MDQERYRRLQELFLEFRELDDAVHEARIDDLDDPELANELRSLLHHDRTSDQLLRPIEATTDLAASDVEPVTEGPRETQAGPYELLEVLGEGGFGTVYRGQQRSPIDRQVAVKLIKRGMDSAEVLARFDGERRTLAKLQHPSIAQVYDVGTTESGLPYFAMELVPGSPIDRFCEDNELSIAARLRLFEQVCEAVHHAHRRGILHRDLKPSNVLAMLDDAARPRAIVIDFGISKALQSEPIHERHDDGPLTQQGQVLGTLEYMSPEQASLDSRELDIRTDIYSLGALLYRILTGQPPIEREQLLASGYWKIYQTLMETTIRRPSEISSLPSSDLDWIVMKTLEKDREMRYATVHDLLRDLQRFRNGEAIEARPPSIAYQFRLLLQKHLIPLLLASVVGVAILIAAVGSFWGWQTATRALDRAVVAQTKAETSLARLNQTLYSSHIANAWRASESRNTVTARRLLNETPVELRGFEWNLLDQRVGRDRLRLISASGKPSAKQLDFDEKTRRLTGVRVDGSVFVIDSDGQTWEWKGERHATVARWLDEETLLVGMSGGVVLQVRVRDDVVAESMWEPRGGVYDLVTHDNGSCAVCFGDGGVILTNVDDLSIQRAWRVGTRMSQLEFVPDEGIVGCGFDGNIYRFAIDSEDSKPAVTRVGGGVSWARDANERGVALAANMMRFFDADGQSTDRKIKLGDRTAWTHFVSVDANRWLIGSRDGTLATVDLSDVDFVSIPVTLCGFDSAICSLKFDSATGEAIVALIDGTIAAFSLDLTDQNEVEVKTDPRFTAGVAMPNEDALATLDSTGKLTIWDLATGKEKRSIQAHAVSGWEIAVSANHIVTVGEDQTIVCWRAEDLVQLWRRPIAWGCRAIAISEDEKRIVAAPPLGPSTREGTLSVYDVETGEPLGLLLGHDNWVLNLAFDGDRLFSTCENRTIRMWSIEEQRELCQFVSPKQSVAEHLVISRDGRQIYSGHRDGSVLVWDIESQALRQTISAFGDQISSLEPIEDRLVATSVSDHRVRIFEAKGMRPITTLETQANSIQSLIVSPNFRRLVLYDGKVGRCFSW
ncbi:MAG: serine/threonine-protein kinase [Planctomycetota bacterium]